MKPALNQDVGDRSEQNILRRLPISPALACGSVPVGDLVCVQFVACGGVHGWKLSFGSRARGIGTYATLVVDYVNKSGGEPKRPLLARHERAVLAPFHPA
jgi:hypothetical protein